MGKKAKEKAALARKPLKVRDLAAYAPPATKVAAFAPAKPPPGVLPQGMAFDSAISGDVLRWAVDGTVGEGLVFLGYPVLAEMAQRPENRRIVEIIAKEMTRKWVRLVGTGDAGEDKAERIKALEAALHRYGVQDLFRRAAEQDGYFGRGQIFVDIRGANSELPLVISSKTVRKGSLKGLRLIEPVWTYPAEYDSSNPLADDFYRPRAWFVMGQKIHATRLLTFVGREVPDILKPAYSFGGLALTQMALPYVQNWLRTRQSVSDLLHSFSVSGIKTNMGSVLAGDDDGIGVYNRADMFNLTRDNRGLMMLDKDTEEFFNVSTPLTTLDKLQAQSQEHMASVSGIPLVKLLGITPSGLNATSDGEIRVFYDWIEAQQQQLFRTNLQAILDIIQMSEFGDIDPDIAAIFEPLWQMDEKDRAEIRKIEADTAQVNIESGVIAPEEERTRLAGQDDSMYPSLDLNVIPELPEEPEEQVGEPEAEEADNVPE